jgi:hypothetical protein
MEIPRPALYLTKPNMRESSERYYEKHIKNDPEKKAANRERSRLWRAANKDRLHEIQGKIFRRTQFERQALLRGEQPGVFAELPRKNKSVLAGLIEPVVLNVEDLPPKRKPAVKQPSRPPTAAKEPRPPAEPKLKDLVDALRMREKILGANK